MAASSQPTPGAPVRLSLQDALVLARNNEPTYQAVATDAGVAREARAQARDALLPTVNFNPSVLYTHANHSALELVFIANNVPHEYISQGNIHESLSVAE